MNKNFLLMLCLLIIPFVSAENLLFDYDSLQNSTQGKIYLYNFPHWIGLGEVGTITSSNYDNVSHDAWISFGGQNFNMTYDSSNNLYLINVISAVENTTNFNVTIGDWASKTGVKGSHVMKFRKDFNVTLSFFKNSNTSGTEVEPYDNEFQYVVLRYRDPSDTTSYRLGNIDSVRYLNAIGNLFPYYEEIGSSIGVTDHIYLWAKLDSGVANVKVYDNASYDMFVFDTNFMGSTTGLYEFGRPTPDNRFVTKNKVVAKLPVPTESNQSFDVFISAWEVYRWNMLKNFAGIVVLFLVWALIVVAVSYATVFWIPNPDIQTKAFASVVGVLVLATSPLFIYGVRLLF